MSRGECSSQYRSPLEHIGSLAGFHLGEGVENIAALCCGELLDGGTLRLKAQS